MNNIGGHVNIISISFKLHHDTFLTKTPENTKFLNEVTYPAHAQYEPSLDLNQLFCTLNNLTAILLLSF